MVQSFPSKNDNISAYHVMDVRIAGKNIRINYLYKSIIDVCSNYFYHFSSPDIIVFSSNSEIEHFIKKNSIGFIPRKEDYFGYNVAIMYDYDYYETLLICEKIADCLINFGIMMIHGAAIEINGKCFVFSAPSGVGKTTHILNWRKVFPNTSVINGDKPFIDVVNRIVYGSPWRGKEGLGINASTHLSGVVLLERSLSNSIRSVQFEKIIPKFIQQIHIPQDDVMALRAYRYFYEFNDIPFYQLFCTADARSAIVAYDGLKI